MAKQPSPASERELNHLVQKGSWYCAMIRAGSENELLDILRSNPKYRHWRSSQSPFTDPAALTKYNWTTSLFLPMWQTRGIQQMMQELRIPMNSGNDVRVVHGPTEANYTQIIKADSGFLMPSWIWSPAEEARRQGGKKATLVPDLQKYSDVIFLEYTKAAQDCRTPVSRLRFILFHNIENAATWAAVLAALQTRGKLQWPKSGKGKPRPVLRQWPGEWFSLESEVGRALLATPLGGTLAWLLIQHKAVLGGKKVLSVNVFKNPHTDNRDNDFPKPSLLFILS